MTSRIQGIVNRVSEAPNFSKIGWILDAPVINLSQSVVDMNMQRNFEFQGGSGLPAKVNRYSVGYCCEWCTQIQGEYEYPDVPPEVWSRHDRCNCVIEYIPAGGGRLDVLKGSGTAWVKQPAEILDTRQNYAGIEKRFKTIPTPVSRTPSISSGATITGTDRASIITSIADAVAGGDLLTVDLSSLGIGYDELEQLLFNELSRAGKTVTVNIFNGGEFVARKRIG